MTGPLLDVGGGQGAHAETWLGEGRSAIVVDPAHEMCSVAATRPGVAVVSGRSQALPFIDACAGLVYFHLSIHYGPLHDALSEACRVARPGARIEIWTFTPEAMKFSALATWFPSVGAIDARRFPPIDEITTDLSRCCASVEVEAVPEQVERTAASWQEAVHNRFVSTLQLVPDAEIERGLARFADVFPDPADTYRYTIDFVRIRARR
jgi:ubiquinone/menaquinone biosynthesis C-methylase UbiE